MEAKIHESWRSVLKDEFKHSYFEKLEEFLESEYANKKVYPPKGQIYNALNLCEFENVEVVILGQDPYHGEGQANGLAFSVNDDLKFPPSLKNIFKEVKAEIGKEIPITGNLEKWAKQGVFLLNTVLTVREGQPGSHFKKGWEVFTDQIIRLLSDRRDGLVFILWGNFAQSKVKLIDKNKHLVLMSSHPSPLSVRHGFFGCGHFVKANAYLRSQGRKEIDW